MLFANEDFEKFKNWINYLEDVDNSYKQELIYFWQAMFKEGLNEKQIFNRFQEIKRFIKTGPLYAWLEHLSEKWICFVFIYKGLSLKELAIIYNTTLSDISYIIRCFMLEKFPQHEYKINDLFLIGNYFSSTKMLTFVDIQNELGLHDNIKGVSEEEWIFSIEVYWSSQWKKLLKNLDQILVKIDQHHPIVDKEKVMVNFFSVVRESFILIFIGISFVFFIKNINQWFEVQIEKKIRLFDPDYLWDPNIFFFNVKKKEVNLVKKDLVELSNINYLRDLENKYEKEERFEEESDLFDEQSPFPKHLEGTENPSTMASYEQTFAFRDDRNGENKIYRIMLRSGEPEKIKERIFKLAEIFNASNVSPTRPVVDVPGGSYFSLFVPRVTLDKFVQTIEGLTDSNLFVTKTSKYTPSGKSRVFIWVKGL